MRSSMCDEMYGRGSKIIASGYCVRGFMQPRAGHEPMKTMVKWPISVMGMVKSRIYPTRSIAPCKIEKQMSIQGYAKTMPPMDYLP
jgi:hypothetical protein